MKITTGHAITPELKIAADTIEACGNYSKANPTASASDNPFWKETGRTHRKATGSVRVQWVCPSCGQVDPYITDQMTTACCGSSTVDFRDHR